MRINSQKSLYSSRHLDKSTSSLADSRHSSRSRSSVVSKKSLSRVSKQKRFTGSSSKKNIKIVQKNIDHIQLNEVSNYLRIFCNHTERNNQKSPRNSETKHVDGKLQKGKQNRKDLSPLEKIVEEYGSRQPRQKALLPKLFN